MIFRGRVFSFLTEEFHTDGVKQLRKDSFRGPLVLDPQRVFGEAVSMNLTLGMDM